MNHSALAVHFRLMQQLRDRIRTHLKPEPQRDAFMFHGKKRAAVEHRRRWIKEHAGNTSVMKMAFTLGISRAAVANHLRALGIKSRYFARADERREYIRRNYKLKSGMKMAMELGCHYSLVYRWMDAMGIKRGRR